MNMYRIKKTWDDNQADWTYRLQIDSNEGQGWQDTVFSGNAGWAIAQVEHYDCGIVKINEEGQESVVRE